MPGDAAFVFGLIVAAAALLASGRVRYDVVALLVVLALMLSGVLSVGEALAGFGSPVVILVAGLLVVGEMLSRTGVATAIGDWILKHGGTSEARLVVVLMLAAAALGAVMSSTAVVAIFIPIVLRVAATANVNASRMLMPMSYAALMSGMLTLIATTPNLVVSEELKAAGFAGLGFFSFTPIGLAVLAVGIAYMLFASRFLPKRAPEAGAHERRRSIDSLWEDFRVDRVYRSVEVGAGSPLAGRTIAQTMLETRYGVRIIGLLRETGGEQRIATPGPQTELHAGDVVLVVGRPGDLRTLAEEQALTPRVESQQARQRWLWELGGAAVMIHPESRLLGRTLREVEFRTQHGLHVLGFRRHREPLAEFRDEKLAAADSLFVIGPWSRLRQLQSMQHDFVVLEVPAELAEVVPAYRRMPAALAILAAMVLLTILDVAPLVALVVVAALAAVATGCLTMEDAYDSIHWSSLVLVAGMLPLADALYQTGATQIVVDALMAAAGDAGPRGMLSVLFFLTAVVGMFLPNTAAAVLATPVAIVAAETLDVSPYPFAVAVLIAASAKFVTPVSTPVVSLVVEPGRYRFMDFVKLGFPLLLLTWLVTLFVTPLVFPFRPG